MKSNFSFSSIVDDKMIQLVDLYSNSLRELVLDHCWLLTRRAWTTIPKCTNLRRLSIKEAGELSDHKVKEIVYYNTSLEKLDLYGFGTISFLTLGGGGKGRGGRSHFFMISHHFAGPLVMMREFSLPGKIPTLRHLNLKINDCDIAFFDVTFLFNNSWKWRNVKLRSDDKH